MALVYEHSTQPSPDGLRQAPRTLRDLDLDPHAWIESPDAHAANAAWLVDDDNDTRRRREFVGLVLRLVSLIAIAAAVIALCVVNLRA